MSSSYVRASSLCPDPQAGWALDAVRSEPATNDPHDVPGPGCSPRRVQVIESPCMIELYRMVERVARKPIGVLIEGETGSGKEMVAAALHRHSGRRGALRAINCGAIPRTLAESILFGHERGAFSGAHQRKAGIFEEAHRGTLLLDEIGELDLQAQAALLRVTETRRVRRIGGSDEIEVDVRIVAATHVDLERAVAQGRFRSDLLYRLNVLKLTVPPLRDRPEELVPLAHSFLRAARELGDVRASSFSEAALDRLRAHAWPGNVRELRNVVERASALCTRPVIQPEDLGQLARTGPSEFVSTARQSTARRAPVHETRAQVGQTERDDLPGQSLRERVAGFEARVISEVLQRCDGSVVKAARELRLPVRTLSRKVKRHSLGAGS